MNTGNMEETLHAYLDVGMALVLFPNNSKGPTGSAAKGWNLPENCITRLKADRLKAVADKPTNVGLCHAYSGTCSIDIDNLFAAREWLAHRNVDLDALFNADDSVTIDSGRGNHGKLLYRLPHVMPQKKITSPQGGDVIDFRCAAANGNTVQDCLPPSYNPDAKAHYQWGGNGDYRSLPLIPTELLAVWQSLVEPVSQDPAKVEPFIGTIDSLDHLSLSHKTLTTIQTGVHPEAQGKEVDDRSWNLIKVLNAMVGAGASEQLMIETLSNPEYPISNKPLERGMDWLKGEIQRAQLYIGRQKQRIEELEVVDKRTGEVFTLDFHLADTSAETDGDAIGQAQDDYLVPYDWMVDGWLYEGAFTFSGTHGVGKTTALVPMCAAIAGLVRYEGMNVHQWRHVLYVAEDVNQVYRVLYGLQAGLQAEKRLIDERFHVDQAHRAAPMLLTPIYEKAQKLHRTIEIEGLPVTIPPLVVFDTASANIEVENESGNSEVSRAIHEIRKHLNDVPFILVCHTAKTLKRADALDMSSRGAGAWEADVQGVFYLFRDDDTKQGVIYGGEGVKRRDAGEVKELTIDVAFAREPRLDRYRREQMVSYPIVTLTAGDTEQRKERAAEKIKQEKAREHENKLMGVRLSILEVLKRAQALRESEPHNPDGYLSMKMLTETRRTDFGTWTRDDAREIIKTLIDDGRLEVVDMTTAQKQMITEATGERSRGTRNFLAIKGRE